jgi:hypothetical protein
MTSTIQSQEEWRFVVVDDEDCKKYQVSGKGKIRNATTLKILKTSNKGGYPRVNIYLDDGRRKQYFVHRLVAQTWIKNPENKKTVNHKDHDSKNNCVENLEWFTAKEQSRHKRKCDPIKYAEKRKRAIWRIDFITGEEIELYSSSLLAAQWLVENGFISQSEFSSQTIKSKIWHVCNGNTGSAYGFKFRYDIQPDLVGEEWREIPTDLIKESCGYQISNMGRFKNPTGRITTGNVNDMGYLTVSIKSKSNILLHRLVAQVFIPNLEMLPIINHIDGNKRNAKAGNLEWSTLTGNSQHAHDTGLCPNTRAVVQYDPVTLERIAVFKSQYEASRQLNIFACHIGECCSKKRKTTGGFLFALEDEPSPKMLKP